MGKVNFYRILKIPDRLREKMVKVMKNGRSQTWTTQQAWNLVAFFTDNAEIESVNFNARMQMGFRLYNAILTIHRNGTFTVQTI